MKTTLRRLFATLALAAATVCASPTNARKSGDLEAQTANRTVRISLQVPASFEVEKKDGAVVGLTTVKTDGTRKALKQQTRPTCATSCPSGQKLSCWEDAEQMMSICVCSGGGSSGPDEPFFWLHHTNVDRF